MDIFTLLIISPMGWIIDLIYRVVGNYGVAIILFTIVIKALLLPLGLKQQRSMVKQQKVAPQLAELQKKYANDKEKLNKETMELYKANGANPLSGCLPMLLQIPIIIGLFQVVQKPIEHMLHVNFAGDPNTTTMVENLQKIFAKFPEAAGAAFTDFLAKPVTELIDRYQIVMSKVAGIVSGTNPEYAGWAINFNFLGLDLSRYPSEGWNALNVLMRGNFSAETWSALALLLIPILSGVSSWMLTKLTPQPQQPAAPANGDPNASAQTGKMMKMIMPLISVMFTFSMPCGVGMYWTVSNIIQMMQQHYTKMYFEKKEANTDVIDTVKKNRKDSKKHR